MTHPSNSPSNSLISLNNVHFRWKRNAELTLDIDTLEIPKGEKVFIKGPSGSGKSTLLNLMAGVLVPEMGQVNINGVALEKLSGAKRDYFRANNIGFIFQMFNLIPYLSVLENVTLPLDFSKDRKKPFSSAKELKDDAIRLLTDLDITTDMLRKPVTELSIGQQQRVAAARAMIGAPPLLIADEPTSALDFDTRETFIKLLFSECERSDITLVFVSHDGSLENLFDRSIELSEINKASLQNGQNKPKGMAA